MKKQLLTLATATLLLGAPAAQSFAASHPVELASSTAAATTSDYSVTSVATTEAATTPVVTKAKKVSFFAKMKRFFHYPGGKSKIVAALLAFFLGGFGVHRFYLGYTKIGIIQLGLTVLGLVLYAAGVASVIATGTFSLGGIALVGALILLGVSIWVFIDFIRILIGGLQPANGSYTD